MLPFKPIAAVLDLDGDSGNTVFRLEPEQQAKKDVEFLLFPFLDETPHCTPTVCGGCLTTEGEGDSGENSAFAAAIVSNHKVHERPKFNLQEFVTLLRVSA